MPRRYKGDPNTKRNRKISDDLLQQAVEAISAGMTVRCAQTQFGISRSALHRYQKKANLNPNEPIQVSKKGGPIWLPDNVERELVDTVIMFASQDNALTSLDLRYLVKSHLDRENLVIQKFKGNMPGYDWSQSFITRHGLADHIAVRSKKQKEDSSFEEPLECFVKVELDELDGDLS